MELDYCGDLTGEDVMGRLDPASLTQSGYPAFHDPDAIRQAVDRTAMSATFVIVTRKSTPNRHGNFCQIMPDENGGGMMLDNYKKNPIVLFDHGMGGLSLPIGISEDSKGECSITLQKTKATGTAFFSQSLPEAAQIFALIDEGILRASSIQYRPTKARMVRLKARKDRNYDDPRNPDEVLDLTDYIGYDFVEYDLYEWSVVGIPADADSVRKMLDRGTINGVKVTQSLRPAFIKMCGTQQATVPGVTLPRVETQPIDNPNTQTHNPSDTLQSVADALAQSLQQSLAIQTGITQTITQAVADAVNPLLAETQKTAERLNRLTGKV